MSDVGVDALLTVAMDAAYRGGRRTLAYFGTGVAVERKADGSPVTAADRASERDIRQVIAAAFPGHTIVGEEEGRSEGSDSGHVWIVDPLDGTRTFIRGVPLYGVLVACVVKGEPLVGAIYLPALDEMVAAAHGRGCTRNGRPCRVSAVQTIADATVVVTDDRAARERMHGYGALVETSAMQRTWGDCYGYVLVATGRADVALDPRMNVWDCAALQPIVEEAGGRFTDWRGRRTIDGGDAVATNGRLHDEVLATLAPRGDEPPAYEVGLSGGASPRRDG